MNDVDLVEIAAGEECQAAKALSIAMLSNPIHIAVLQGQGETERQHLEATFSSMLKERPGEVSVAKHEGAIVGVLRSYNCRGRQLSHEQPGQDREADEAEVSEIEARIEHWTNAWAQRDPLQPHRHLGPVGVLPQLQRLGIGSKMMERFCEQADANHEPAFLETDSLGNVRFYEKFRFRSIDESLVFGVRNFFMWRPGQK
jgi:ribosomal protein S18 acetylase RimI-like enzyme